MDREWPVVGKINVSECELDAINLSECYQCLGQG